MCFLIFLSGILYSGYAEKWAKARLEQQELKLHLQKKDMLDKLNEYSKEYNVEQIISAETNTYLEADIKEKEEQLEMWTKKYNKELAERQQEIEELQVYMKIDKENSKINNNPYNIYIYLTENEHNKNT